MRIRLLFGIVALALTAAGDRTDDGHLRRWLVLAPVPFDADPSEANLDRQYLGDEVGLKPREDESVTVNGQRLVWKKYLAADHFVDFNAFVGQPSENATAYAVCYIHSDKVIPNVTLKLGSDDHCKIYFNNREVHRAVGMRAASKDSDSVPKLIIRNGVNILIVKVCNGNGDWGCCARFVGADGKPVPGLTASHAPDPPRRR